MAAVVAMGETMGDRGPDGAGVWAQGHAALAHRRLKVIDLSAAAEQPLVDSEPHRFLLPRPSELRYRWVHVRLAALDHDELRELLVDAWRMCVPKTVAAAYEG